MSAKLPPALVKIFLWRFGVSIIFFLKNQQNNPKIMKEEE